MSNVLSPFSAGFVSKNTHIANHISPISVRYDSLFKDILMNVQILDDLSSSDWGGTLNIKSSDLFPGRHYDEKKGRIVQPVWNMNPGTWTNGRRLYGSYRKTDAFLQLFSI